MQFKTLGYYLVILAPGLVLNIKEPMHRASRNPIRSMRSTPLLQTPAPLPVHKNKTPTVWIFAPDVENKPVEIFGYGEDEEEGSIPNQWYCWEIELHHRKKIIQTSMIQGTKSLTFAISRKRPSRNPDWYHVRLSISDTNGGIGKDSVDFYPNR